MQIFYGSIPEATRGCLVSSPELKSQTAKAQGVRTERMLAWVVLCTLNGPGIPAESSVSLVFVAVAEHSESVMYCTVWTKKTVDTSEFSGRWGHLGGRNLAFS